MISPSHPSFYDYMKYPIPQHKELYTYIDETHWNTWTVTKKKWEFSWEERNEYLSSYIEYIQKWEWIYKSLPFVKQIYLCNSITFNALHKDSDIDICIITKSGYLRWARFRSVLSFWLIKEKRQQSVKTRSFCLSFYIDENHSNIYHLRHTNGDVYLPYRLAHCVLLYTDDTLSDDFLRRTNKELLAFLPNHPFQQTIGLWTLIYHGNSNIKNIIQYLLHNKFGRIVQQWLSIIRKPILYYKRSKLKKHIQQEIIILDTILKFHDDKRHLFQFRKRNSYNKDLTQW